MNTTCVDPHDPPVRTVEEVLTEHRSRVERASVAFQPGAVREGRGIDRTPSALALTIALKEARGEKRRLARWYGVHISTLHEWLRRRGVRVRSGGRAVYSHRGLRWENVNEAAESLGLGASAIRESIRWKGMTKSGHRLSYRPFPRVSSSAPPAGSGTAAGKAGGR